VLPDFLLQLCCALTAHIAVDLQEINWAPTMPTKRESNAIRILGFLIEEITQIRMRNRRAQDEVNVQVAICPVGFRKAVRIESHDNIGDRSSRYW
jgi:hypothetical protein